MPSPLDPPRRRHAPIGAGCRLLARFLLAALAVPTGTAAQEPLPLADASIADIQAAFDEGSLTAEALVEQYRARIEAYDRPGPALGSVLWINEEARERARALDRERREDGPRSALHGIPVVLKDNVDTGDMPTTAGSALLAGSVPPDDAFLVRKLRDAGAIVLAKVNMSELASGVTMSSAPGGGWIRNPHDLARSPSGSSGGTGVAVAAAFAQLGIGTDTGGSVRGPSTANGIVGLKPTHGLLSRDGIVPLALSFDVPGPMGRHVRDVALMLGAMTGLDPADTATARSEGRAHTDYTPFLDEGALQGARIGVLREVLGADGEVDWIVESSLEAMREAGARVVDVSLPAWLWEGKGEFYTTIRWREFRDQIPDYLATLGPGYPRTLEEMVARSREMTSPTLDGARPNPTRWSLLAREEASGSLSDAEYRAMRDHGMALVRTLLGGIMEERELDALVYPTSPTPPSLVDGGGGGGGRSATNLANLTGFPDLIIPAGFTSDGLPVGLSFLGPAFSEPRLLALGYAFEQRTGARRSPVLTPPLPGEGVPR
jgi:amidase